MNTKYLLLIISSVFIYNCAPKNAEESSMDISNIVELDMELIFETGQSNSYMFGRIYDLSVTTDGIIFVSDRSSRKIDQFNVNGEHVATIASAGNGPGELPIIFNTFVNQRNNELMVFRSLIGSRLDIFKKDENNGVYRFDRSQIVELGQNRILAGIFGAFENNYLVSIEEMPGESELQEMLSGESSYRKNSVYLLDENFEIEGELLHEVNIPMPLYGEASTSSTIIVIGVPPYRFQERIQVINNNEYILFDPRNSSYNIYNINDESYEMKFPIPTSNRRVTDQDLDYHLMRYGESYRMLLEDKVEDFKPPFTDALANEEIILLEIDESEDSKKTLVMTIDGEIKGLINISNLEKIKKIIDNRIYVIREDDINGDSFKVYRINI